MTLITGKLRKKKELPPWEVDQRNSYPHTSCTEVWNINWNVIVKVVDAPEAEDSAVSQAVEFDTARRDTSAPLTSHPDAQRIHPREGTGGDARPAVQEDEGG
jgi:hypothetical protein